MLSSWFDWFGAVTEGGSFPWLLAAGTVAGLLGTAAFRRSSAPPVAQTAAPNPELDETRRFEPSILACRGEQLSVASEARWAMAALAAEAQRRGVRLEVAVAPGLRAWMDPRAFRKLLVEMIAHAIDAAPYGRVLLAAGAHGGRVQIGVTHDGPAGTRKSVEGTLRPVSDIAAMTGGTFEVIARAGHGATVLVRLPEPTTATVRAPQPAAAAPERAQRPASPERVAQMIPEAMITP